jgi:hypothetical protein
MKKTTVRPNLGGALRPRAKKARKKFLYVEVTREERNRIQDYCVRKQTSFSQFLAETMLKNAAEPKSMEKVRLKPEFDFTPEEYEKLQLLAILHNKRSVNELIRELIQDSLDIQKLYTKRKTSYVRFYLSREEHAAISSHIATKSIPAGKYAAMVVLRALEEEARNEENSESGSNQESVNALNGGRTLKNAI